MPLTTPPPNITQALTSSINSTTANVDRKDDLAQIAKTNEDFFNNYVFGPQEKRAEAVAHFFASPYHDPNYDDGLFFVRAAENQDRELLQKLIENNQDPESLADGLFNALMEAADRKYKDLINFLFAHGADPDYSIKQYSVYYNDPDIKACIDEQIEKRQKKSTSLWAKPIFSCFSKARKDHLSIGNTDLSMP